jgi:hypothetical protein
MRAWSDTELLLLNENRYDADADMGQVLSRPAVEVHAKRVELGLPVGRKLDDARRQAEATDARRNEVHHDADH